MKTLVAFLLLWFCLPIVKGVETSPTPVLKPKIFSVRIGGALGTSYQIDYAQGVLRYRSAPDLSALKKAKPSIFQPTDQQWQTFSAELDRLKVWGWQKRYENPNVLDGTSWSAAISYSMPGSRDLNSSGINAYPAEFKSFLAAVRKLVGEKNFE